MFCHQPKATSVKVKPNLGTIMLEAQDWQNGQLSLGGFHRMHK